MTRKTAQF